MNEQTETAQPAPVQNDPTETAQPAELAEPANHVAPIVATKSTHKKSKTVASKYLSAKPINKKN